LLDKIKIILFSFLIFGFTLQLLSQEFKNTDSLEKRLYLTQGNLERVELLIQLADLYIYNKPVKALLYADEAYHISNNLGDEPQMLQTLLIMAKAYRLKTDLAKSLQSANRALEISSRLGYQSEYAMSILDIGKAYRDLGDNARSSESCFKALEIFEKIDNKKGIADALNSIGNNYFDQKEIPKSYEYYQRSLAISKTINDKIGIARGLNNVADYYSYTNETEKVIYHYKEAIRINSEIGQMQWVGINLMNIGEVLTKNNHPDSAVFYIRKSIAIFEKLNNIPNLVLAKLSLCDFWVSTGNLDKAIDLAQETYELVKDENLLRCTYQAALNLHDLYKIKGDLKNTCLFSEIQHQLNDSLETSKSLTKISQLELQAEFDKINQQKIIEQQRQNYIFSTIIIIIIFVFISIIIVIFARNRIKVKRIFFEQQRLEADIEYKNKELTSKVMTLMKKNEINSELSNKLLQLEKEAKSETIKSGIKNIVSELHKSKDKDVWEEFNVRFKEVHTDFYLRLIKNHPDISPSEQRLCAFLKLNLSTKDISELTGLQFRSIENARSKLRKKLKITNPKDSLVSFLARY